MERLHYKIEYADNGIIIKDIDEDGMNVFQMQGDDSIGDCTKKAISESIAKDIASVLMEESKDKFKINIAIF